MNLPSQWNYAFRKGKGSKKRGGKWISQLSINRSGNYPTVPVETEEETLVQRDILLVKHCIEHITISPELAQVYIFKYGLVRPAKYVNLGWYESIESLLSHSGDWVKGNRVGNVRGTKTGRFHIVESVEKYTKASKQAIALSYPMDESFICLKMVL